MAFEQATQSDGKVNEHASQTGDAAVAQYPG